MKKNIVFIINIENPKKPGRTTQYHLSIESWKHWCEKNSCDLFVLTEPLVDLDQMNPIFSRHYIFEMVDVEDSQQICTVDADTIIHPDCPNFFELTSGKYCGVHNDGDYDWIIRSIENYQYEFSDTFKPKKFNIWKYINSGFMITNPKFKFVHEQLINFYWTNDHKIRSVQKEYGVGTDQPLINLFLDILDVDVNILPYQFNMQDLSRKNILDDRMLFTRIPGIYHFNAIPGGPPSVNMWMEKTFKYIFK